MGTTLPRRVARALERLRQDLLVLVESPGARPNWLWLLLYWPVLRWFRGRRMARLVARFALTPRTRVLDLGGTPFNWRLLPPAQRPRVLILNVEPPHLSEFPWVVADALYPPFRDGSFDLLYSNSVIEHLGDAERQRRFAALCQRLGQRYYVQTPNRRFFFEPHLLTPFVHWLPRRMQRRLLRYGTLWGLLHRPDPARIEALLDELRLLSEGELRALFPGAELWRERVLGMSKSFVVMGEGGGVAGGEG